MRLNLWHENGLVFAKDKFVIFDFLTAKVGAAHCRTFFACTKKVPKKYTEGVRTLSTPGDAVKFLRFDGDTGNFTGNFAVSSNARKRSFSLLLSHFGLTHQCFLEIFGFLLYWVLVLCLSFRAGIYGTKTGVFSRKIKFVIFACSPAKVAAAHCRLSGRGLTHAKFYGIFWFLL